MLIAGVLLAVCAVASAFAQMPPAGPSGLNLEIAGQIDPYQMPVTRDDGQVYDLSGRFYYARYVDTGLPLGSLERAKTARYGVYFSVGGASRWVIKPEWSGLFPVNSDYAIVRKPGAEDWLSLQIDKTKTTTIGKGDIRIMDVLHREATATFSADPVYRYYISSADNGDTQTVALLRWNDKQKKIETWGSFAGVMSPASDAGLPPLQLTYGLDVIMRSPNNSDGVQERVVNHSTIKFHTSKTAPPLISRFSTQGPFVFTAPSRLLLKVLDAKRQLYLPYLGELDTYTLLRNGSEGIEGFLGVRPVGERVTADLRDNPLYQPEEAGLAALWETPDGVRLAPLLRPPHVPCYQFAYDKASCPITQVRARYIDYPGEAYIKASRSIARYVAIEHIDLPEEVRDMPGSDTRIAAALLCVMADGRVDIWAAMPAVSNLRASPTKMNPEPFATRKEAEDFVRSVSYPQGLNNYRIAENNKMFERIAEGWRVHEQNRRAALTPAQRAQEDREDEWRRQRAERSASRTARVQAQLDAGNVEAAMEIAMEDWADLPKVVNYALANGRSDLVGDEALRHVHEVSSFGKSRPDAAVANEYARRFPPSVRAAGSSYQYQSLGDPFNARRYADPAPLYTAPDYQMESKMNYLSGLTSSYMCGSSSFCH